MGEESIRIGIQMQPSSQGTSSMHQGQTLEPDTEDQGRYALAHNL